MSVKVVLGIIAVAAVATAGDYVWSAFGVRHRALAGVIHGAALLTAVGGVLGAVAGRFIAGLPMGMLAGVAGALAYYSLAPAAGQTTAMVCAWALLWLVLAALDGLVLQRPRRTPGAMVSRGVLAAIAGGAAFALSVGYLWGRQASGSYLVKFGWWCLAWAPGLVALTWPSKGRSRS